MRRTLGRMAQSRPTRILIISDTHSGFPNVDNPSSPHYSSDAYAFRPPFPQADVLIHTGDTTMLGRPREHKLALEMLSSITAELKLVIAGNHELSLDKRFYLEEPDRFGRGLQAQRIDFAGYDPSHAATAERLWTGEEAKKAGVTYLTEGMYSFTLSNGVGFSLYASPWQPDFHNWAFNYPHHEDRWNPPHLVSPSSGAMKSSIKEQTIPAPAERDPHPIPEGVHVDILITHGPPYRHLDQCADGTRAGCPHLLQALDRVRPSLACFGHIHEGWGAERCIWQASEVSEFESESGVAVTWVVGPLREKAEVLGSYGSRAQGDLSSSVQYATDESVLRQRAATIDVSSQSERPLAVGKETIMINSSIMDISYRARGAPWLVTLDLPVVS